MFKPCRHMVDSVVVFGVSRRSLTLWICFPDVLCIVTGHMHLLVLLAGRC